MKPERISTGILIHSLKIYGNGILKSFARTMQIFAKGTTDPGIKLFNLFQCFKSINNLCLNFSTTSHNLANIWGKDNFLLHRKLKHTSYKSQYLLQPESLQSSIRSRSFNKIRNLGRISSWFGRKREIDAITLTNTRNNF